MPEGAVRATEIVLETTGRELGTHQLRLRKEWDRKYGSLRKPH